MTHVGERQKPLIVVQVVPAEACGRTVIQYRWLAPNGAMELGYSRAEVERRIGGHTDIRFETPSAGPVVAGGSPSTTAPGSAKGASTT